MKKKTKKSLKASLIFILITGGISSLAIFSMRSIDKAPVCSYEQVIHGTDKHGRPAIKREYLLCADFNPLQ